MVKLYESLNLEFEKKVIDIEKDFNKNRDWKSKIFGKLKISKVEKLIARKFFFDGAVACLEITNKDMIDKMKREGRYP